MDWEVVAIVPEKMLKLSLPIIERRLSVIHLNIDYEKKLRPKRNY